MVYESDKWWLNSYHNERPEDNETNILMGWRSWGRRVEGGDWQLRILYSAKLSFKNEGERKTLLDTKRWNNLSFETCTTRNVKMNCLGWSEMIAKGGMKSIGNYKISACRSKNDNNVLWSL